MITINLLPEELRIKGGHKKEIIGLIADYLPYITVLAFGALIFTHVVLAVLILSKSARYYALSQRWEKLAPERAVSEGLNNERAILSTGSRLLQQLAQDRIIWSRKLNKISLELPSMVWLRSVVFSGGDLVLQGSVLSLEKEEIRLIKELIDNLKKDALFFREFNSMELDSVQKRTALGYDIADFILRGKLRAR